MATASIGPVGAVSAVDAFSSMSNERAVRRQVAAVWALLVFNTLAYAEGLPTVVRIPHSVGKVLTQGALAAALGLAIMINRRLVIRPNTFLVLFSLLAASTLMISIRDEVSLVGTDYRAVRLICFVLVLWLLTPWWGRKDMLITRFYLRCLIVILASVICGLVVSPHSAIVGKRLEGALWPIPPTQVAHYAALVVGIAAILWLAGGLSRNKALVLCIGGLVILLLTHTRTALVALGVAVVISGMSLFAWRRSVRRALLIGLIVALIAVALFLPELLTWLARGESGHELTDLSGRTNVWSALLNAPRTTGQVLFGFGMSNDSFGGLAVDNSWLVVYQNQGLFGDAICGLFLLVLLIKAGLSPRGQARSVALFLVVYCLIASVTETGLGNANPYMIDLAVAASLLIPVPAALYEHQSARARPLTVGSSST